MYLTEAPNNVVETASIMFTTKMLQQSDMLSVVAADVARYYADHGLLAILPVTLPCQMDAFGIIIRRDRALSPAAKVMLRALKTSAMAVYGKQLDTAVDEV